MGKTITESYLDDQEREILEQKVIAKAVDILDQHGVHNGLGITQQRVSWLRRKKELDLRNALFVLFNAGELEIK